MQDCANQRGHARHGIADCRALRRVRLRFNGARFHADCRMQSGAVGGFTGWADNRRTPRDSESIFRRKPLDGPGRYEILRLHRVASEAMPVIWSPSTARRTALVESVLLP